MIKIRETQCNEQGRMHSSSYEALLHEVLPPLHTNYICILNLQTMQFSGEEPYISTL